VGRAAGAAAGHRRAPRAAALAKKALSIRPQPARGADARQRDTPQPAPRGRAGASGPGRLDWPRSLQHGRPRSRAELHYRSRLASAPALWLIVVDASASTRRHGALRRAKGLLAELLDQARRRRVVLALLQADGARPRWFCQGQRAPQAARRWLEQLGAGGGTPLPAALAEAGEWLARRQRRHPGERQQLWLLTDGRLRELPALAPAACPALLIDIESGPLRLGRARELAAALGAEYRHIDEIPLA
jgi:magnesium chelatase subunit ChlD-like protein